MLIVKEHLPHILRRGIGRKTFQLKSHDLRVLRLLLIFTKNIILFFFVFSFDLLLQSLRFGDHWRLTRGRENLKMIKNLFSTIN